MKGLSDDAVVSDWGKLCGKQNILFHESLYPYISINIASLHGTDMLPILK